MTKDNLPQLSTTEKEVWEDSSFFNAKRTLIDKIAACLAELETELRLELSCGSNIFPESAILPAGKISRGENLLGYPYILLDYPRLIQNDTLLIYRTICWLGHGCSSSIIASNRKFPINLTSLLSEPWLVSYGNDIWNNNPTASCYREENNHLRETEGGIRIMRNFGLIQPALLPALAVKEWLKMDQLLK